MSYLLHFLPSKQTNIGYGLVQTDVADGQDGINQDFNSWSYH